LTATADVVPLAVTGDASAPELRVREVIARRPRTLAAKSVREMSGVVERAAFPIRLASSGRPAKPRE
jgi:hypothetical protein